MKKIPLIRFECFKSARLTALNIINWGEYTKDGRVRFSNKDGMQVKTPQQIRDDSDGHASVVHMEDIDLKDSLFYWFKKNNQHGGKPCILDQTLETGEVYNGNCWHVELMVHPTDTEVRVKIVLPETGTFHKKFGSVKTV